MEMEEHTKNLEWVRTDAKCLGCKSVKGKILSNTEKRFIFF